MNMIASPVEMKTTTPMIPRIKLHLVFSVCVEYAPSSGENLHIVPLKVYVTLEHKNSLKGQFFEIEI